MSLKNWVIAGAVVLFAAGVVKAQDSGSVGIPVNHQLTIDKCGGCHQRDAEGMMRRLSYMRTTPEVWEQAIKRMVRLNGLVIKPEEARDILRFLCNNNGLAPEEAKPFFREPKTNFGPAARADLKGKFLLCWPHRRADFLQFPHRRRCPIVICAPTARIPPMWQLIICRLLNRS